MRGDLEEGSTSGAVSIVESSAAFGDAVKIAIAALHQSEGIIAIGQCGISLERVQHRLAAGRRYSEYGAATRLAAARCGAVKIAVASLNQAARAVPILTGSGSEAVDTALKIALAYHKARGEGSRTRLIGRERGYHGVGFGGLSVGGIGGNRKNFGPLLSGVDHLPHTHNLAMNAFTRGEPEHGMNLADELERIVALHDASTIAAVIVEPVAGSTGVLIPPKGYLKRLRDLCTKHGILLIFDEVITGFGRLTTPFASDYFDVEPDMMTTAKGLTNGVIPMGAVFSKQFIYDTFMQAPTGIELFHGYTYSGHPVACAAALATLEVFEEQKILQHAKSIQSYWEDAVHSLKGLPHVIDLRSIGVIAGIELESIAGKPGARAFSAFKQAFADGLLIRTTGDIIALSPPLVLEKKHIDELFGKLTTVLKNLA